VTNPSLSAGLGVSWLVCGIIAAVIGLAKNRSAFGWFLLGALFAPSVLIVAVLAKLPPRPPAGMLSVQCPRCNAVQNISYFETTFECWRCKLVYVAGSGYVAAMRGPDGPEDTREWLNRVKGKPRREADGD
jgi:hypothetical protein